MFHQNGPAKKRENFFYVKLIYDLKYFKIPIK